MLKQRRKALISSQVRFGEDVPLQLYPKSKELGFTGLPYKQKLSAPDFQSKIANTKGNKFLTKSQVFFTLIFNINVAVRKGLYH